MAHGLHGKDFKVEVCGRWGSLLIQSQEAGRNERNAVRQYGDGGSSSCRADCQKERKKEKIGRVKSD